MRVQWGSSVFASPMVGRHDCVTRNVIRAVITVSVVVASLPLAAAAARAAGGEASINLTKTVSSTAISPRLALTGLDVAPSAIPGDSLTYTTTLINAGADVNVAGQFSAANGPDVSATVAAWWDDIEYKPANSNTWVVLGGFATAGAGYSFVVPPPATTGLTVTASGVAADGVTYPTSGDGIVGATMQTHASGVWNYQATLSLSPDQVNALSDPTNVKGIRNVVHFEVTPRDAGVGQPFTYRTDFTDPFATTSATATDASVTITPSYAAPATIDQSGVSALASIACGQSVTVSATFAVPPVPARQQTETDADYLARLRSTEGSSLTATATAAATGSSGPVTATAPGQASTIEHLPIMTIAKSGPATADAGTSQVYPLALANSGGAAAGTVGVTDSLPDGNSGVVTDVPATLAPAGVATAEATYDIPVSQPDGPLTDIAAVSWQDANGNAYGPVSSSFTTQVQSSFVGSTLTLSPQAAGPNPLGVDQTLVATFTDSAGNPIPNQQLDFAVVGPNAMATTATTDENGQARLTYEGAIRGADQVQASFTQGALHVQSNTSTITWISPLAAVASTPVQGNFYAEPSSSATFVATPASTPAFGQTFPTIDFNPPSGIVNHNISGVGPTTRPFTDITTDAVGNFNGTIVAQGNGMQAGVGSLSSFDAVFTADFVVAKPGDVTFNVISDDGFLLGVGGGASRVNGAYENPPASNVSPFQGYPLVGAFNESAGSVPGTHPVTVHFPAAGDYPYELDYFECCGSQLSLTMTVATFNAQTSPLSVYVGYADGLRPAGSIFPFPWYGSPNVIFEGCTPNCTFDGGAIRLDNSGTTPMTVDSLTTDFGNCHFAIWPSNLTLPPGDIMIFSQTANGASSGCDNRSGQFDTSDLPYAGFCGQNGIIPRVNVTMGGVTQSFDDTDQVLDTDGEDVADCRQINESHAWERIGGGGTPINVPLPPAVTLQLTPPSASGDIVGQPQRLDVTALDASGDPVANLPVTIAVFGSNTQLLTATTDANGIASTSYTATAAGSDTLTANAFVSGLRAVSNAVDVTWVVPTPMSPPAQTSTGTGAPSISNVTPAPGTVISGPTPINASLAPPDGGAIASWSVTLANTSGGSTTTLAAGNGTPPAPLATLDPAAFPAGTYTLTISVSSAAGGTATVSSGIVLGSSGGGTAAEAPPAISSPSPAGGTVVTAPIPVTATLTPPSDQTIASWVVTYQGAHASVPTTLAAGTGTPPDTLATFDPTTVPNDTYTITVTATASGGGIQSVSTSVAVSGNLKPGRFTKTYDDLDVPVGGVPMAVHRVYDNYDTSRGDFGSGWKVSLSNFRESTNGALGLGGWSEYPTSCFFGLCNYGLTSTQPHYVTVTFPDNHQEMFDFTPSGGSFLLYWQGVAAFTPRPGTNTTSTLTIDGDPSLTYGFDGNLYDDSFDPYSPTRFDLTTKDGRKYVLDINTGLVSESDPSGNSITIDSTGVHSSAGPSIVFTRDGTGRITRIAGPNDGVNGQSQHLDYGYNDLGQLTSVTDVNGNVTAYSYDASGTLSAAMDADHQPLQTVTYGPDGRVASIALGDQPPVTYTTSAGARQEVVIDPNGRLSTVFDYDDRGNVIEKDQTFDGRTLITKFTYDAAGRVTDVEDPLGHHQTWVYDESDTTANGNLLSYTDASGRTVRFTGYDAHGHAATMTAPDGSVIATFDYDPNTGLLLSTQRPGEAPSVFTYYPNGLKKTATDAAGRMTSFTYNSSGYMTSESDSTGRTITYTPDAAGRNTSVEDQSGNITYYTYDGSGDITSIQHPDGVTETFHYNARGLLDQAADAFGTTSYTYNDLDLVAQRTDRNGAITTYQYDADGKLTQETRPGNDVTTYRYDPLERLVETDNAAAEVTLSYDDAGRVLGQTTCAPQADHGSCPATSPSTGMPTVQLQYGWDDAGNEISVDGPGGATGYRYDADGRLDTVTDPALAAYSYSYDAESRLSSAHLPNGVVDTFSYDPSSLLAGVDATLGSTTLAQSDYTLDPVTGQRTSMTNTDGTAQFSYQNNGWLASASYPSSSGLASQSYTYDGAGNVTSTSSVAPTAIAYDNAGRLVQFGSFTYTYDGEGNLVTKTDSSSSGVTTYHWNADHQLTAVDLPDGTSVSYTYDPLGRRVSATSTAGQSTYYAWDAYNLVGEYDGSGQLTTSYVTMPTGADTSDQGSPAEALEETRGTTTSYFLHDGSDSTVATTDATGAVTSRYAYDAFGLPATSNGAETGYTWTGAQYDPATGLYFMQDRYYDPQTGRFISQDPPSARYYDAPLGRWSHHDPRLDTSSPISYNRYAYAGNDPVNASDPSGDGIRSTLAAGACIIVVLLNASGQIHGPAGELLEKTYDCIEHVVDDWKERQEAEELAEALFEADNEPVAELVLGEIEEDFVVIEEVEVDVVITETLF